MPRKKKVVRRSTPVRTHQKSAVSVYEQVRWGESYTSLFLGVIVVFVAAFFLVSFVRSKRVEQVAPSGKNSIVKEDVKQELKTDKIAQQKEIPVKNASEITPSIYTVQTGDNLWSIAEKTLKSGYNWVDIAQANNLENPGLVFAGTKLTIPKVEPKIVMKAEITPEAASTVADTVKITQDTYIIQRGDDLWDIAVRAYGDGFRWVDIAKANGLDNPALIHADNSLKIPRP